jgi:imidazole glycerol phosphate synthase glutamine amidotransferase subunit
MGWNQLEPVRDTRLLQKAGDKLFVYFAHSYYCPVIAETAATCEYTVPYTALLEHKNVYGVQFHPEKSGAIGLQIVRNFVEC